MIEHSFLATVAAHPEVLTTVSLSSSDFASPKDGKVFHAIQEIIRKGQEPDAVMVASLLEAEDGENWLPYLAEVFDKVPVPANVHAYQDVIKANRLKSLKISAATEFLNHADEAGAVSKLVDKLRHIESNGGKSGTHIADYYDEILQRADDVANGVVTAGLPWGIDALDSLTNGIHGGDSIVIAARTSVGKTAFMCNLAVNINAPCCVISGEQPGVQITERVLARLAGLSAFRLRTGRLRDDEFPKLIQARDKLKNQQIIVVDTPRPSIDEIERIAQSMVWKHGIKALFVDYLQLVTNRAYPDKRLQVSDISARAKALARELDIPVFMLAQLNRGADGQERPRMSNLKESGSIEEDADVVLLLSKVEGTKNRLFIDVQKNRHGMTGYEEVHWDAEHMRIS